MGLNLTKMSPNGQVVIPAALRREYKVKASTQFVVIRKGRGFYLDPISEEEILRELEVMEGIDEGMTAIERGDYVEADTSMSVDEIDKLLMS